MMVVLLLIPSLNIYGLIISVLFNIVFITGWHYIIIHKKIGYSMDLRAVINGTLIIGITFLLGRYLSATMSFFTNPFLNMIFIMMIVSIAYLFLIVICGLFPTQKMTTSIKTK